VEDLKNFKISKENLKIDPPEDPMDDEEN